MKKLLIISNNVLSYTNNNGKTMLSFVEGLENVSVSQLYFSGENPKISDYNYFQISDKDIINGLFCKKKRGRKISKFISDNNDDFTLKKRYGRNDFTLILRDLLWWKKWKSKQLNEWINEVRPDALIFVAGDSVFAYDICKYVRKLSNSTLTVYVTDDYIMHRHSESIFHFVRRIIIKHKLRRTVNDSNCFYTVSEVMRNAYVKELGKDSHVIANMTEDLKRDLYIKEEKEMVFTYAGSFYYNRFHIISKLAHTLKDYNDRGDVLPVKLCIYSNSEPEAAILNEICVDGVSYYGGSLNKEQLIERLNTSDVLVFVESFDDEQIEKVRYSLSTKVPEYMSIGKPILAIGPEGIGSMEYLKDVAFCVNDENEIGSVDKLINNFMLQEKYGNLARNKFLDNHDKATLQNDFIKNVLGLVN